MAQLSLAQSPPLAVPMRFLATAPLFGVLTALLVLWVGPDGLANRWTPATLAVTHLLVLGVMGSAMLGALLQIFPVVIGHSVHRGSAVSRLTHGLLVAGVLLLAFGLLRGQGGVLLGAVVALAAAVAVYLLAITRTFCDVATWGPTGRAVALALVALAVTAGLGIWLALGHTTLLPSARQWTDLHLTWGLVGWFPLLLAGVAYQVVPMFQVTPNYPRAVQRWLAPGLFTLLLLVSGLMALGIQGGARLVVETALAAILGSFAVITLDLQRRRRRRLKDVTVRYWRLAMAMLLLAIALWLSARLFPVVRLDPRYPMALGVLMLMGTAIPVIYGMLYKIVPFLVWLHLTHRSAEAAMAGQALSGPVPNMKQIIGDRRGKRQFHAQATAIVLALVGVAGVPLALTGAALAFVVANALLLRDIVGALTTYRRLATPVARPDARSVSS